MHFSSALGMGTLLLGAGSITIYSTLLSTSMAVFIENPMLSLIVPGSAMALKLLPRLFTSRRAKKLYRFVVSYMLTPMIIGWIALFSLNFNRLSGDIILDGGMSSPDLSTLYTALQLGMEMITGTILFMVADDISDELCQPNPLV